VSTCRVHFRLAQFADVQLQAAARHVASEEHAYNSALLESKARRARGLRTEYTSLQARTQPSWPL
jgi:hypothetical protein